MNHSMRIDLLRSAVEAAGVSMAPGDDEFGAEAETPLVVELAPVERDRGMDAGNYSRSWAAPKVGFKQWFTTIRWRALSN